MVTTAEQKIETATAEFLLDETGETEFGNQRRDGETDAGARPWSSGTLLLPELPLATEVHESASISNASVDPEYSRNDFLNSTVKYQNEATLRKSRPLVRVNETSHLQESRTILQQWEGIICECERDSFCAELRDLSGSESPEIVELSYAEFSEEDRPLLQPGQVFYWSIGNKTSPGGTITHLSEMRVRRTPKWSRQAIKTMEAEAEELLSRFNTSGNKESS